MGQPRVLLGDDHPMVVAGIRTLLQGHYEVIGSVADGLQLVEAARQLNPDIVVLDISMPLLNGLEAAKMIRTERLATKIVFLSMHANPMYLRQALEIGALGYVLKTGMAEELLEALRSALNGEVYLSPGFAPEALERSPQSGEALTDRQRQILQLIAEGRPHKEIAHVLTISTKTVDFHKANLMSKLGVRSTAGLTRIAIEQGLISISTS